MAANVQGLAAVAVSVIRPQVPKPRKVIKLNLYFVCLELFVGRNRSRIENGTMRTYSSAAIAPNQCWLQFLSQACRMINNACRPIVNFSLI